MNASYYRRLIASRSRGPGPVPLLLDVVPGALAAWSFRKLRAGYSGPAARARRSDNAVLDVGFTSSGDLDAAALLAWAGASSAWDQTWYEQVGSNNLVQATATLQPRLVNAGAIEVIGTRPCLSGDNADDRMSLTSPIPIQEQDFTYFAVLSRNASGSALAGLSAAGSARSTLLAWNIGNEVYVCEGRMMKATGQTGSGPAIATTRWELLGNPDGGLTTPDIRLNGAPLPVVQHTTGVFNVALDIIMRWNSANGAGGKIAEHILFPRLLSPSEIAAVEADLNAYYSVF